MYVRPVLKSSLAGGLVEDGRRQEEMETKYECPMFMNKARQVCLLTLPLNTRQPSEMWLNAGVAIILDPGQFGVFINRPKIPELSCEGIIFSKSSKV